MQRELRRLAHGADKKANADNGHQHPAGAGQGQCGQRVGLGKSLGVIERAGISGNQTDAQNKAEVTNTVD